MVTPGFLRCFRDPCRVPRIENWVPTGLYRVSIIFLKKNSGYTIITKWP